MASQYQPEDIMDWVNHLEYLKAVLKKFDVMAVPMDELLISYFRNGLRLSIQSHFDEIDWKLNNWLKIIKKDVNAKAKITHQPIFRAQKSNTYYLRSHKLIRAVFKNKKNSKIKKTPNIYINHNNSDSGQSSQLGQTLDQSVKKCSDSRHSKKPAQPFGTSATGVNVTMVKKD